ncbi:hypothetical protein ACFU9V_01380, partial [Streptomyces sp. NPDC057557]
MSGPSAADVPDHRPAEGSAAGRPEDRTLRPYGLRCEHRTTPMGIDEPAPRLSWRLASDRRGDDPVAYRVRVAERPEELDRDGQLLWDTGQVKDSHAAAVEYAGPALPGRTRYHWRVSVWPAGTAVPAEATSWFETALTDSGAWRASWITHDPHPVDVMDAPTEGGLAPHVPRRPPRPPPRPPRSSAPPPPAPPPRTPP